MVTYFGYVGRGYNLMQCEHIPCKMSSFTSPSFFSFLLKARRNFPSGNGDEVATTGGHRQESSWERLLPHGVNSPYGSTAASFWDKMAPNSNGYTNTFIGKATSIHGGTSKQHILSYGVTNLPFLLNQSCTDDFIISSSWRCSEMTKVSLWQRQVTLQQHGGKLVTQ